METIHLDSHHPWNYFEEAAQLHIEGIHHGVLPLLGKKFLTTLYYELARTHKTGVWVIVENGKVMGFICGCANLKSSYRSVVVRPRLLAALMLSRLLVSPTLLKRALSLVFYPFRKNEAAPVIAASSPAELLAIAVSPEARGKGVGKKLVAALEEALLTWDANDTYTVTTNIAEVGSNAFYRALGFVPSGTVQHHALTLQIYSKPTYSQNQPIAGKQ